MRAVIKNMANMSYSDEQRAEFLEVAAEIGITRAMRQLGFPAAWGTAKRWCDAAGVDIPIDEIKSKAKAHHDWYQTEEMLLIAQEGLQRVYLALMSEELDPDQHKKMSEAFQKYANTWLLLQGKANNINETRHKDSMDIGLVELLNEQRMRNEAIESETEQTSE